MPQIAETNPKILLVGLDPQLASDLSTVLEAEGHATHCAPAVGNADVLRSPDLIFCASEAACFQSVRRAVQKFRPGMPIVVVSRCPEVSEWLDAIESGAADYCAAPFETSQMRWILTSNLRHSRTAAA